jgi:hypothetical protein
MLFRFRYQDIDDAHNSNVYITSNYYKADNLPSLEEAAERLKKNGIKFDETTLLIERSKEDEEAVRKSTTIFKF